MDENVYVEIDLNVIPPTTVLHEPDDFKSFRLVVRDAEHVHVPVELLKELAGERADDPGWQHGLQMMLDYAQQHGWVSEDGVRAHVERLP
jgi:hypothetical protein